MFKEKQLRWMQYNVLECYSKETMKKAFGTIYVQFSDDQGVSICPENLAEKSFLILVL